MILASLRRFRIRKHVPNATLICYGVLELASEAFPWAYDEEFQDKKRHQARFEAISLVAISFIEAFRAEADLCQAFHDTLFDRYDMALREQGVGDIAMSHRMKKFAAAFAGRLNRYTELLKAGDMTALAEAIVKNTGYTKEQAEAAASTMQGWVNDWQGMDLKSWLSENSQKERKAS